MKKDWLVKTLTMGIVLLVLGLFTNVVGYQSVKSSLPSDSLLFKVRTKRAINQVNEDTLTFNYLGKGKDTLWKFPMRDKTTEQLKKVIEVIIKMNEKVFAHFIELVIQGSRQDEYLRDINTNEIIQILHKIREQPKGIINSLISKSNVRLDPTNFNCASILFYEPGCTFKLVIIIIIILLSPILIPLIQLENIITIIFDCW